MRRGPGGKKRDLSEPAIVQALRAVGAEVWHVSGAGLPDLLVRRAGALYALEVKSGKAKRTEAQMVSQFPIVRTPEDALRAIGC